MAGATVLDLGAYPMMLHFQGVVVQDGMEVHQVVLQGTMNDGSIWVPVLKGDTGTPGTNALPWKLQPQVYATFTELQAAQPLADNATDRQKAFFVGDATQKGLYLWTGTAWQGYPNILMTAAGPAPDIDVTVTAVPPGTASTVDVTGNPADGFTLAFNLEQAPGEEGPAGATTINVASWTTPPAAGDFATADPSTGKLIPTKLSRTLGPFSIPPTGITPISIGASDSIVRVPIASLELPAQTFDYRHMLQGAIEVFGGTTTRVDIEVRVGSTTGTLVGYGRGALGNFWQPVEISSCYEEQVTPNTGPGIIAQPPAAADRTLYVNAVKVQGTGQAWAVRADRGQVVTWLVPTAGAV